MNKKRTGEDILRRSIYGYHQYDLTGPVRVTGAGDSLCGMLGAAEAELTAGEGFASFVHPEDRARFDAFLEGLRTGEQTASLRYRLISREGAVLAVIETVTVRREQDGTLSAHAVMSPLPEPEGGIGFINDTVPCGLLKYTCEKQPRVTYMNARMRELLRFPEPCEGELDYQEAFRENIFMMIPIEERRRFYHYLNRVYTAGTPIAGEVQVLRCDGTRAYLFGWVTKTVDEHGREEFQSVCMDVTEHHRARAESESKRYIRALSDVYDKIFEFDLGDGTVTCLLSRDSPMFKWVENIPVKQEEAVDKWIAATVVEEDRERVLRFFSDFRQRRLASPEGLPPQIAYRAVSRTGDVRAYGGIFIKTDEDVSLFCLRRLPDTVEAEALRSENMSLKKSALELITRFTDGAAAFEIADGRVRPLYASDNVCEFFGYTMDEWRSLMETPTPIGQFVSRCDIDLRSFQKLLDDGEAEFVYFDLKTERERRMKAVCSQKISGGVPRYVMLYDLGFSDGREKRLPGERKVFIRTFGYFDVFVDDRPIAFRSRKSKELLALLVDRRGGFVTSEEAVSFLWEDEPMSPVTAARYRKAAMRLRNILEEYGIPDMIESVDGKRRVIPERVSCDLYDYLSGREGSAQLFKGAYLTNYSWGENTLAELTGSIL